VTVGWSGSSGAPPPGVSPPPASGAVSAFTSGAADPSTPSGPGESPLSAVAKPGHPSSSPAASAPAHAMRRNADADTVTCPAPPVRAARSEPTLNADCRTPPHRLIGPSGLRGDRYPMNEGRYSACAPSNLAPWLSRWVAMGRDGSRWVWCRRDHARSWRPGRRPLGCTTAARSG
jgi:hypothetical protein